MTYPNWPLPIFLPIAKSDFLNGVDWVVWAIFSLELVRWSPFITIGWDTSGIIYTGFTTSGALKPWVNVAAFGESKNVLGAVSWTLLTSSLK